MVMAPYGVLQSLLTDRDLRAALRSVASTVTPGGMFGIDLVPDIPTWEEYRNRVRMRGGVRGGTHLTLVESVSQDRRRRLTRFDERYLLRRGRQVTEHKFALTFRTLSVPQIVRRLKQAGFTIQGLIGDYRGRPWDDRAGVWIVLARRV
jgi:hypothetical protein